MPASHVVLPNNAKNAILSATKEKMSEGQKYVQVFANTLLLLLCRLPCPKRMNFALSS